MSVDNSPETASRILTSFARTTDQVVTLAELRERLLSDRQLVMKYGVDLTAPDMHIGHAVNLWMYRDLQEIGHKVVLLLGDYTTRIGDPTGRSKTRSVLTRAEIEENAAGIYRQAMRILSAEPDVFEVRRNSEWLDALPSSDLLTLMSNFTVDKMMSREMFRKRGRDGVPVSMHELVYPILQGWDSVALDADLTIIGSDQLFNEMIGRDLQARNGQKPQVIVTTKITPGLDGGEKQSKSLGNYVAVEHEPRQKFGRLMSIPDELIDTYAAVYSGLDDGPLAELTSRIAAEPRRAKMEMAAAVVARYHGWEVADAEVQWFNRTFSDREIPADAPSIALPVAELSALDLLRLAVGSEMSVNAMRRLIEQGAVRLNGEKLTAAEQPVRFETGEATLKVGRRQWFRLVR